MVTSQQVIERSLYVALLRVALSIGRTINPEDYLPVSTDNQKRQEEDIKEAAQLLEEVSTNPELREMLYDSHAGKKYYIDNFSKDAQDILKDIIKDYYNK